MFLNVTANWHLKKDCFVIIQCGGGASDVFQKPFCSLGAGFSQSLQANQEIGPSGFLPEGSETNDCDIGPGTAKISH